MIKKYICPECGMQYDSPGICEMDGAKLIKKEVNSHTKDSHNHHDHHKMMMDDFKKRFIISSITTIPILLLSPLVQDLLGISYDLWWDKYILFILSSFLYFWGGYPFLKGSIDELKQKKPGMMTLVALAISVAYIYSTFVVFGLEGNFFFWELATLIDIMLLGHYIEMKSVIGASKALEKLAELMPSTAHLKKGSEIVDVDLTDLNRNDVVLIKAGEKIPADGEVIKGNSYINESMLTGESKPVEKKVGENVIGGSINGDRVLEIRVHNTGGDSYLSKVIDLVQQAQNSKSETEKLADIAARWLTIIAITAGVATFVYWYLFGADITFTIERVVTVMVIACPHALGLAIPLVNAASTSISAKNGLLIRNRTAFENARKVTTVIFDKTGTLTEGHFGVSSTVSLDKQYSEADLLRIAASLEQSSEHPIAKGIIEKVGYIERYKVSEFEVLKGEGIQGYVNGNHIQLLSEVAVKQRNFEIPDEFSQDTIVTKVFILISNKLVGAIFLEDSIREESSAAIKHLQDLGIETYMLTGDNEETAKHVSEKLNLDGYFAEVLPHQKQEKIRELQENGKFVAMTGDGINDAPALALADIGIAIGAGTDIAAETADIILVNSDPRDIVTLLTFGQSTYNKMVQNLFWATGYNAVAIPLAAGVLFTSSGFLISPAVGAALMTLSTVVVAINAKLLRLK